MTASACKAVTLLTKLFFKSVRPSNLISVRQDTVKLDQESGIDAKHDISGENDTYPR